jgi:glyoxylase-like metal-dependent hydrolase (beta-lactamase superfamily II)
MHPDQHKPGQAWICAVCGTQFEPAPSAPSACPICQDERQYVGWGGQEWLTPADLRAGHAIVFQDEAGVATMRIEREFAIGQQAYLIPHAGRHLMWECLSLVTKDALHRLEAMGGVAGIAVSHPHFYAAMIDWSDALGGVPIYLHASDRHWVQRRSEAIRFWEGDRLALSETLELVHLPGHFPGSAGVLWKDGPRPGGAFFPGDAIQVAMDRRFVTFMYSYPNAIPLGPAALDGLEARVAPLAFDDVFGYAPGRRIIGDAKTRIEASFDRYRRAIAA